MITEYSYMGISINFHHRIIMYNIKNINKQIDDKIIYDCQNNHYT